MDEDNIPDQRRKEFKNAFEIFDRDKDGIISADDLAGVMRFFNINPSQEELEEMIAEVDVNGNRTIDLEEFIIFMNKRNFETNVEEEILNAFKVFDKTDTNQISVTDFRHIMTTLSDHLSSDEIESVIDEYDPEKTGFINYEDLIRKMVAQ